MKRKNKLLFLFSILLMGSIACNASLPGDNPPSPRPPIVTLTPDGQSTGAVPLTEAQVPRIEVDKARDALDAGEAVIIDVRSPDAYAVSHAEGAINIPLGTFETDIQSVQLEKDQWIITYCT